MLELHNLGILPLVQQVYKIETLQENAVMRYQYRIEKAREDYENIFGGIESICDAKILIDKLQRMDEYAAATRTQKIFGRLSIHWYDENYQRFRALE